MTITKEIADILTSVDTPTISNALDIYRGDRSVDGFTQQPFVSSNPRLKPIIGIARTAKIKASAPSSLTPEEVSNLRLKYYEYMAHKPATQEIRNFCVIEDLDWPKTIGSFWGEVNVSIHKGLGLAGTLTNGLLRDLDEIDKNYMVLASAIGPSHAYVHVVEFGIEVTVSGLNIKDGDIIHADQHGALKVPPTSLEMLPRAIQFMQKKESYIIEAAKKNDFDIEKLKVAWSKSNSEKFE
tara:strand:- start:168 stop:884 length:717 start_codon:yes stop_codon:yes gene_type:complete